MMHCSVETLSDCSAAVHTDRLLYTLIDFMYVLQHLNTVQSAYVTPEHFGFETHEIVSTGRLEHLLFRTRTEFMDL